MSGDRHARLALISLVTCGSVFQPIAAQGPLRHLFTTERPAEFARAAVAPRRNHPEAGGNSVLTMLLVHAVRDGDTGRARDTYRALVALERDASGIAEEARRRAKLFERIGAI